MSKKSDMRHGWFLLNEGEKTALQLCDHPIDERCRHFDAEVGETVYEADPSGESGKSSVGWSRAYDANWERTFRSSDDSAGPN